MAGQRARPSSGQHDFFYGDRFAMFVLSNNLAKISVSRHLARSLMTLAVLPQRPLLTDNCISPDRLDGHTARLISAAKSILICFKRSEAECRKSSRESNMQANLDRGDFSLADKTGAVIEL